MLDKKDKVAIECSLLVPVNGQNKSIFLGSFRIPVELGAINRMATKPHCIFIFVSVQLVNGNAYSHCASWFPNIL